MSLQSESAGEQWVHYVLLDYSGRCTEPRTPSTRHDKEKWETQCRTIWIYCRSWIFHWEFSGNVVNRVYSRSNYSLYFRFFSFGILRFLFFWLTQFNWTDIMHIPDTKKSPLHFDIRISQEKESEKGNRSTLESFGSVNEDEGPKRVFPEKKSRWKMKEMEKWRRRWWQWCGMAWQPP